MNRHQNQSKSKRSRSNTSSKRSRDESLSHQDKYDVKSVISKTLNTVTFKIDENDKGLKSSASFNTLKGK